MNTFTRARLDLIEYAAVHTLDELLSKALDEVGAFVHSPIGFYHFVESDQKTVSLQQWSTLTLKEFCQAEGRGRHYSIDQAGVWVDCVRERKPVIHNDYRSLEHKKGMPEGHAKVVRELVAPVMREGKVVAILGVGNKPVDYTEKDAEIVAYLADVTWEIVRCKRDEEIIAQQNEFLKNILESLSHPFYVIDANDYTIKMANSITAPDGIPPNATCFELTHKMAIPCEAPLHCCPLETIKRTKQPFITEHIHYENGDDRYMEVHAYPIFDIDGNVVQIVEYNLDVTERKLAEEKLRQNEITLRTVLDQLPSGVTVRSAPTGAIILANARGREIAGNLVDDAEQFSRYRGFYPDGRQYRVEDWPFFRSMITGEVVDSEDVEYERPDGVRLAVSISSAPIRDSQGQIIMSTCVFNDVTERKQMEDELRKSRDELELRVEERTVELQHYMSRLEESNQALQDFAFIASHDLHEPLRKVISFGNMLRQKYRDSLGGKGNDYLNRMLDATARMQSLLKGLLEYSRVAAKADPFVEVKLTEIVSEVLSDLEVRIKRTGAEVQVLELPVVKGDPTQMRQLFQNLIGNALKFHKQGENPAIKVRSTVTDSGELQVVFEDNGIGFEEQYLNRIFAPFERLHGRSSQYKGTGMGLAICKKIVERHGGSITAKSTPGVGTSFIIQLPMHSARKVFA